MKIEKVWWCGKVRPEDGKEVPYVEETTGRFAYRGEASGRKVRWQERQVLADGSPTAESLTSEGDAFIAIEVVRRESYVVVSKESYVVILTKYELLDALKRIEKREREAARAFRRRGRRRLREGEVG